MHRFATAPLETFEELFEEARFGTVLLDGAVYPPGCGEPCDLDAGATAELTLGPTGAMIVHVRPGRCQAEDFQVRLLFEKGTCVFAAPAELHRFWTGPLARAFGIGPDTAPDAAEASPAVPERKLTAARLAAELARVVHGQEAALERVASTTVAQLTKRHPARPGSVLLIGPTGVGKTSTVEALPAALKALGHDAAHVHRLDCGELTDSIQVTRLLGAPPGYVGYAETTALLTALARPGCILLVDEVEKAHPEVLDLLLGLLDAGRLTGSTGEQVDARHAVVVLTTSIDSDELVRSLGRTPLNDRWAVQRACAEHLRASGLPADLVGRIGAFAAYGELETEDARRGVAEAAVVALGREYGLAVVKVDPVVLDVVGDIAAAGDEGAGARALHHAARELLAEHFATLAEDGPRRRVAIEPGPPLTVRVVAVRRARTMG